VLTQPYIRCQRLATKHEIDSMVAEKAFRDGKKDRALLVPQSET
jgi:hypothetical protein